MSSNSNSECLDRIERLIEESNKITLSNSRVIQAMLEARATEKLEHEERMGRMEETIRAQHSINEKMANLQQGLANMLSSIDEDRPTILRKLNTIENRTDVIDRKLDRLIDDK